MSIPLYYINLHHRPDRHQAFQHRNIFLTRMTRYQAVDGREVKELELRRDGSIEAEVPPYTKGAWGCALSHRKLWELAVTQHQIITIAEDDVYFRQDFENQSIALMEELPSDWDMVYWGYNLDSFLHIKEEGQARIIRFDQNKMLSGMQAFQMNRQKPKVCRVLGLFGSCAYTITPTGAAKLLNKVFPLQNRSVHIPGLGKEIRNMGIDVAMNGIFPGIEAYACYPPLAIPENNKAQSDVQVREVAELSHQQKRDCAK